MYLGSELFIIKVNFIILIKKLFLKITSDGRRNMLTKNIEVSKTFLIPSLRKKLYRFGFKEFHQELRTISRNYEKPSIKRKN